MPYANRRIEREYRTIEAMIALYCHGHHGKRAGLCPDCTSVLEYSLARLKKCPLQENKPACGLCPVHCYNVSMRARIQSVMRYSGPRMLYRHPILALFHMIDARKKTPVIDAKEKNNCR
jgi:hypothetical protein